MTPTRPVTPRPAPFVVGVARSGTTLLRLMLDRHSDLAIPAETHFVPRLLGLGPRASAAECLAVIETSAPGDDFGSTPHELAEAYAGRTDPVEPVELLRAFYRIYARGAGKSRWGDKTPTYLASMGPISTALPEAVFVHIIRDARAVAASRRDLPFGPGPSMTDQASDWADLVRRGRAEGTALGARYVELRYEDLVRRPETELRRICDHLALPYESAMLAYDESARERLGEMEDRRDRSGRVLVNRQQRLLIHAKTSEPLDRTNVDRWRDELSADQIAEVERIAGPLLGELGYG